MIQYPKVPRYNHDCIEDSFYESDDLVLLEKVDGSNFRFIMYDERYANLYKHDFYKENKVNHGDIVFGSKTKIRGKLPNNKQELEEYIDTYDGAFRNILYYLQNTLDKQKLDKYHTELDTPLQFFGENMIPHTIDYSYDENPPEPFIGFDIYKLSEEYTLELDPFEQLFDGFIEYNKMKQIYEDINLKPIRSLDIIFRSVNDIKIPKSKYGPVKSEGVIIRSDKNKRRVKYRSKEFKEKSKKVWGINKSEATTGAEIIQSNYLTNGRIRKKIIEQKYNNKENFDINKISNILINDIFTEEHTEIRKLNIVVDINELNKNTKKRIKNTFERLEYVAELNKTEITEVWNNQKIQHNNSNKEYKNNKINYYNKIKNNTNKNYITEKNIIEYTYSQDYINEVITNISNENNKEIGSWLIGDTLKHIENDLWINQIPILTSDNMYYNPHKLTEELKDYTKECINNRDDIQLDNDNNNKSKSINESIQFEKLLN